MQIQNHSYPSKPEDTPTTVNPSFCISEGYNCSLISAITIGDDFYSSRRFDTKLHSSSEQNRATNPGSDELKQCLDALRFPDRSDRFSSCSEGRDGAKPCVMPRRRSSSHNMKNQAAKIPAQCNFFLDEETSRYCFDEDESKQDFVSSCSLESFSISLKDEDGCDASTADKLYGKRRPRRSYRGRQKSNVLEDSTCGYSRSVSEAQSLELIDVFGDRFNS